MSVLSLFNRRLLLLVVLLLAGASCATISTFDQYAYTQSTSLKVDALSLMGHANESYANYSTQAASIQTALDKVVEYERNRPKNGITLKMWGILTDSSGNLYGGFIRRWKQEDKLDTAFISAAQQLVGASFDQISQLESGKIHTIK